MKKLFLVSLVCLFGCSQQDNNTVVVGAADKMSLVYIGVDNPIDIAVSGVPANQIKVKTDTTIAKIEGENGKYNLKVKKRKDVKIYVYKVGEDKKETLLDSSSFRVKMIPAPAASISGVVGEGPIKKDELLNSKGIEIYWGDLVFDMNMPVVNYTMSLVVEGQPISIEEDGPAINDMMKKYIRQFEPNGQKIIIEDVMVKTPDGSRRKIQGMVLKLKN